MAGRRTIVIDSKSSIPKYKQIIACIYNGIEKGYLKKGDKIPSINKVCIDFKLSRDTVMLAFNILKEKGILMSQPGKGYYINSVQITNNEKIFVLFDELNAFKEDLYNSLINNLKGKANVDVFFHHFNYKMYKNLLSDSIGNYTSYIIMPATFDNTSQLISKIPKEKVFILDRLKTDLKDYSVVYQDFELDFYDALVEGLQWLKKYRKLIFVNPGGKEPKERIKGFEHFCEEYDFKFEVIKYLSEIKPSLYEAYFLLSDRDLVDLVKFAKYYKMKLGKKFGIVSFNDTMLKEVVAGGITTISTDFKEMGKILAEMVLNKTSMRVRNTSRIIIRKSL